MMDKEDIAFSHMQTHTQIHANTYNSILFSHKKDEILPFAKHRYFEDIMLSEVSQRKINTL